ncbi:MAG: glucose-1-phosphate cytidylyltransferase [Treponema sp.]|jgi:glucose-1-phosphate cytidylyltransferase|nr:glucose-1-phosphate cytidylyltransferase [Treponema sp.]
MKVAILAGGLGTRLSEETGLRPKPMVEIGGRPILWHIMKAYSHWGFNDFVVLTGYLSHVIKDFFINYYTRYSDVFVDLKENRLELLQHRGEPWRVTLLYTGAETQTGGRLLRARDALGGKRFMLTYGDGVSDVDIPALLAWHEQSGKAVTLTAVRPEGKFGALSVESDGGISRFQEKPIEGGGWINGGFFVMEPAIFEYLSDGDATVLEREPLERLARDGRLGAYKHNGFWRPMDTLKDKNDLTALWQTEQAPWALWSR